MSQLAGIPYVEISFDKDGDRAWPADVAPEGTTDLVILSHGWKNDEAEARSLYEGIVRSMLAAGGRTSHLRFAVLGVIWPSFRYKPDLTLLPDDGLDGPAASFGVVDVDEPDLLRRSEEVAAELGVADVETFALRSLDAAGGGGAADGFVAALRAAASDPSRDGAAAEDHSGLFSERGSDLFEAFAAPPQRVAQDLAREVDQGSAQGFGSSVASRPFRWLSGGRSAVATILNQFTYFEMKTRAGVVGRALAEGLDRHGLADVRVHLVGHSFGARLVASAAASLVSLRPGSLTLLQGAFSHNGFGRNVGADRVDGAFRRVVAERLVRGPVVVTHTHRDSAVGFFYALASTVSRDVATGLGLERLIGGPEDLHGGIGANGALAMPEGESRSVVAVAGEMPSAEVGVVTNVLADAIVEDHNDVRNAEVGRVVWAAISAGACVEQIGEAHVGR